jgi:hypothetical protein
MNFSFAPRVFLYRAHTITAPSPLQPYPTAAEGRPLSVYDKQLVMLPLPSLPASSRRFRFLASGAAFSSVYWVACRRRAAAC